MTKKKKKKKNLTEGEGGTLETRVLFIQSGKLRKSTTDLLFFKLRELILEKKKNSAEQVLASEQYSVCREDTHSARRCVIRQLRRAPLTDCHQFDSSSPELNTTRPLQNTRKNQQKKVWFLTWNEPKSATPVRQRKESVIGEVGTVLFSCTPAGDHGAAAPTRCCWRACDNTAFAY